LGAAARRTSTSCLPARTSPKLPLLLPSSLSHLKLASRWSLTIKLHHFLVATSLRPKLSLLFPLATPSPVSKLTSRSYHTLIMPVELRKRKAPQPAPEPPAKKPTKAAAAKAAPKVKASEPVKEKPTPKTNGAPKATGQVAEGDVITLDGFGGEVETNEGTKTTLKALVDESKAGVVLFTYPKASTPGCKCLSFSPSWRVVSSKIGRLSSRVLDRAPSPRSRTSCITSTSCSLCGHRCRISLESTTKFSLTSRNRHHPGLPFPGLLCPIDGWGSRYLWAV
jgi:hypothetical protein